MLRKEQNDLLTQTGPGTPMGSDVPQLLDSGAAVGGTAGERLPAGAGEAVVGAPAAFRDSAGTLWPDRRVLRPSRRLPLVRAQRGMRHPLSVSRLEVSTSPDSASRCRRSPRKTASPASQSSIVPASRAGRHSVDLHGARRRSGRRCPSGNSSLVPPARRRFISKRSAGMQLAASDGRRHRFQPCVLAASGDLNSDPLFKGAKGNQYNLNDMRAGIRGRESPRRALHRRAAQCGGRQLLLADHAVGHAVLHDDAAARRPSRSRPFLDSDRRRNLLGLELTTIIRCAH